MTDEPDPTDVPDAPRDAASAGDPAPRPKRRPRYKGTHPRRFEEKYKELRPELFPDAVEKAKARGSTPAGMHLPVMIDKVVDALEPLAGATILDCTLGWGGHASELAQRAGDAGLVIGLDRDGEELVRTEDRLRSRGVKITVRRSNYAGAAKVLRDLGLDGVDALLADLGVSSMQLDRPERGLSFKVDGPLDMRMDRSRGETAAEHLARAVETEAGVLALAESLTSLADEPDALAIAQHVAARVAAGRAPATTHDLVDTILAAKNLPPGRVRKEDAFAAHPATRTFQALRILVNREHEALSQLLRDLPWLMRSGGRVALLTFHSGEEKIVGDALAAQAAQGLWTAPPATPLRPAPDEVRANPRARSARLWRVVRA